MTKLGIGDEDEDFQMRTKRGLFPGKGLQVDMSPMIDLVFLLLIFFMVKI